MRQHLDLKSQIYESESVLQATLQKISQDSAITEANRENIAAFVEDGRSRGLTSTRLAIVAHHLRRLGRLTKADFNTFSTEDAKKVMKVLEATKYSEWVKVTCKKLFKQLMRSYNKPAEIYSWIVTGHPPNKLRKEDLLTPEELRQLIASAPDNMWKSLISLLAETGCRPCEAVRLKLQDFTKADCTEFYVTNTKVAYNGRPPRRDLKVVPKWVGAEIRQYLEKAYLDGQIRDGYIFPTSIPRLKPCMSQKACLLGLVKSGEE